jgi:hypothetical protein
VSGDASRPTRAAEAATPEPLLAPAAGSSPSPAAAGAGGEGAPPGASLPSSPRLLVSSSRHPSPAARAALALIRGYRGYVSPLLPPACRFEPTCSEYGHEAIAKYGIIRGGRLAVWRILRCNPFGRGGYDPVP